MASVKPNAIYGKPGYRPFGSDLDVGELIVNASDGELYTLTEEGKVIKVGSSYSTVTSESAAAQGQYEPLHHVDSYGWQAIGPSGSRIFVGGEAEYRDFPQGLRRGALEVLGTATDASGNRLNATINVVATHPECGAVLAACDRVGHRLVSRLHGSQEEQTNTFAAMGPTSAAFYTDAHSGLALGFSDVATSVGSIDCPVILMGLHDVAVSVIAADFSGKRDLLVANEDAVSFNVPLTVPEGLLSDLSIRFEGDEGTGIRQDGPGVIAFYTGGLERFRITESGPSAPINATPPTIADIPNLEAELAAKAPLSHTHTISQVTGLQAELDSKLDSAHTHTISQVTGLQAELDSKLDAAHTHTISQVTGLQADLDTRVSSTTFNQIVQLTQAQYDALAAPQADTLYVVVG